VHLILLSAFSPFRLFATVLVHLGVDNPVGGARLERATSCL
jgi:hypothetical protein